MNAKERARRKIEARDWCPEEWDWIGGAWDAVSSKGAPEGRYGLRAYPAEDPGAPREALCEVWVVYEGEDMSTSLGTVGIPTSEEAPRLLREHAEICAYTDVGGIGQHILDLETGEVLTEQEAQKLLKDPLMAMAEQAARHLRASGYPVVEVKEGGKVHAETEVLLGEGVRTVPVVLTIGEDVWAYEVERAGYFGEVFEVAPGRIVTPEEARNTVKHWWRAAGLDDEYEIWRELMAMRHPGEEPPTEEEVRAALEDYRRRTRRRLTAEAAEAAEREREGERFVVKPGDGDDE